MDLFTAKKNLQTMERLEGTDGFDESIFISSLEYLIENESNSYYALELGGYYYNKRQFDLALKYYEIASIDKNNIDALNCLGYIYYYGRTGVVDYKKAFECFREASHRGHIESTFKLADMYKNGYYVEKSYDTYVSIIKDLYSNTEEYNFFYPEISMRMARINKHEGNRLEAIKEYLDARTGLEERASENQFFGNINMISWIVEDLYQFEEYVSEDHSINIYDAFYLLKNPNTKVCFTFRDDRYEICHKMDDEEHYFSFNGKNYHRLNDIFEHGKIESFPLAYYYDVLKDLSFE